MLQRIEDIHRAVLRTVFVAGNEAPAYATVVGILTVLIELPAGRIQSFNYLRRYRSLLAQPDRTSDHQNVGCHDTFRDRGPVVAIPAVLRHVGPHAGRDLMVNRPHFINRHAIFLQDRFGDFNQALRVRGFRRLF